MDEGAFKTGEKRRGKDYLKEEGLVHGNGGVQENGEVLFNEGRSGESWTIWEVLFAEEST